MPDSAPLPEVALPGAPVPDTPRRPLIHRVVGRLRKVPRALRNRARRLFSDAGHAGLALLIGIIHRAGFDRSLAWATRRKNRLIRTIAFTGLAGAISGVDRIAEMQLAWKARWHNRDYALAIIAASLNSMQKYAALRWWVERPVSTKLVRDVMNNFAIDGLTRANDFDAARAYAARPEVDPLLKARTEAEVALRHGDVDAFRDNLAQMAQAGSEKRWPTLRWLTRFVDRDAVPAGLLPPDTLDDILRTSKRTQSVADHATLLQLLKPRPRAETRPATWHAYWTELQAAMRARDWDYAAELAANPVAATSDQIGSARFTAIASARADCLAARGRRDEAHEVFREALDTLVQAGEAGRAIKFVTQAVRRFPTSQPILDQSVSIFEGASMARGATIARNWRDRYGGTSGYPERRSDRCFVVANGPSVREMPLHLLAGEDIFTVNRGFQAVSLGLPPPRFLAVSDVSVYRDYWREIDAADVEALFLSSSCLLARPETLHPRVRPFGSTMLQLSTGPLEPCDGLFHLGTTVVLSVCQLAFFMGYTEINVLGVDLTYDGPLTHFYGVDAKGSQRLSTFRTGDNGEAWVNAGFSNLRKVLEPRGVEMRNVGRGGNLHALPRVPLETAIATGAGRPPPLAPRAVLA